LVNAIQATGRDAILRGSGEANSTYTYSHSHAPTCTHTHTHTHAQGAAVSILESYAHLNDPGVRIVSTRSVNGLARMVQVSATTTLVDLTVSGVSPGRYHVSVRALGDLGRGALSVGPTWGADPGASAPETEVEAEAQARGDIGTVEVGADGRGALFVDRPFAVWEVVGRSVLLAREDEELRNGVDTLVGVVARSAGVWDNDKLVCSCTGKTLWDERRDRVQKGMI